MKGNKASQGHCSRQYQREDNVTAEWTPTVYRKR